MPNFNFDKEDVLATIQQDGLCKIDNFLNEQEIQLLKDELLLSFNSMETGEELNFPEQKELSYPFGKICRVPGVYLNNFPNIVASFNHPELHELTDRYFNRPHQKLFQVFFSHEYLTPDQTNGATRNSVLHVDPYHAFKFMIYLTDCDEESGAFRYIKGSHIDGQKTREGHSIEGLLGDKYRLDENPYLSEKYSEDQVVYASAKAGSLLVFTTDIIHGGGIIQKEGLERIGIICHNR
tara:strand:- start:836 stop:1546 length:711 start_codon:yes stop_codon:yes gene_type:complete